MASRLAVQLAPPVGTERPERFAWYGVLGVFSALCFRLSMQVHGRAERFALLTSGAFHVCVRKGRDVGAVSAFWHSMYAHGRVVKLNENEHSK